MSEQRRDRIAQLALQRVDVGQIARELACSPRTVRTDLAALRRAWVAEARARSLEERVAEEARVLDLDEARLRARLASLGDGQDEAWVRGMATLIRYHERRARLLGLDAADRAPRAAGTARPLVQAIAVRVERDPEAAAMAATLMRRLIAMDDADRDAGREPEEEEADDA